MSLQEVKKHDDVNSFRHNATMWQTNRRVERRTDVLSVMYSASMIIKQKRQFSLQILFK